MKLRNGGALWGKWPNWLVGYALLTGVAVTAYAEEVIPDTIGQRVKACVACHGDQGRASNSGYYPRIAGKPEGYLYNQLLNFRDGRRNYPAMVYMVTGLTDDYLREIAHFFAQQHPPYPAPQTPASAQEMTLGAALVNKGDAARVLPACAACHGPALAGVEPGIPSLLGLPRDYLFAQLNNWKNGERKAATPDCMHGIVGKLSAADMTAVAAWLSSQPVANENRPAAQPASPLPLRCGSMPQ